MGVRAAASTLATRAATSTLATTPSLTTAAATAPIGIATGITAMANAIRPAEVTVTVAPSSRII
jgi:hypothetical protein